MTWTRHWQLSAEGQSLADVVEYSGAYSTISPSISSVKKFTGGYSYRQPYSYTTAAFGVAGMNAAAARLNFMFNHEFSVASGTAYMPLAGFNVGGQLVSFYMRQDGNVGLRAGYVFDTTTIRFPFASVPAPADLLTSDLWLSIGMTGYFAEVGGFVTLYVNGQQVLSWMGDTRVYASNSPGGATPPPLTTITGAFGPGGGYFYGISTVTWGECYVDDFYVDTGDGTELDVAPTTRRFFPRFRAASADILAQMTPVGAATVGECIDDAPPDDDTTYALAGGAGLKNIIPLTDVTLPDNYAPRAQIALAYAKKTDAGVASTIKLGLDDAVEGALEGSDLTLPVGYNYVFSRFEVDANGVAWTQESINDTRMTQESSGAYA